jgi:hypothetical protein
MPRAATTSDAFNAQFERRWRHQLHRIKERAERESAPEPSRTPPEPKEDP